MSTPPPITGAANWSQHARATVRLGLPLIGGNLAQQAISVTDTAMLGWLGAEPLAAGVLAAQAFFICFIVAAGFGHAVMPLAAEAAGQEDTRAIRRSVRMGLWVTFLAVTAMMPLLWQIRPILIFLGQDAGLSALAEEYMRIAQWALYPATGAVVLRSYLAALEQAGVVLWAAVAAAVLNGILNWMFIFGNWGAPAMGIEGAAIATIGSQTLAFGLTALYIVRNRTTRAQEIFNRILRPDWEAFRGVLRLGLPISATFLAEAGLFTASSLMMGWIGVIELAAHGIALQVIAIAFMIPLGLASAGTVRIGRAQGRSDPRGIAKAGWTVLVLGTGIAALAALLLVIIPETLLKLFLDPDDPAREQIIATGTVLLIVAALFQIVDSLQVISVGLLRGLKDTARPMSIAVFSYWIVGVPAAYVLAFPLGTGGVGIWAGLALGLLLAAVLLTWRFLEREPLGLVREGRS